jgi:hypothetical protein
MSRRALLAVLLLTSCAKESSPEPTRPPPPAPATTSPPAAETQPSARSVADEVEASMTEFLAYAESVLAIMREHGASCDLAAKHLESRAAVFRELGPRLMKVKASLNSLPEPDRERIKQQSDQAMQAFKARNPDADQLEQRAKTCEQTSPAFRAIAPQVMLVKTK